MMIFYLLAFIKNYILWFSTYFDLSLLNKSFLFQTGKVYFYGISINFVVAGIWTSWSLWGQCSATCGGGIKERSRSCTDPAPAHGGATCSGEGNEKQNCSTSACAGESYSYIYEI